jgi:hypothetical protein
MASRRRRTAAQKRATAKLVAFNRRRKNGGRKRRHLSGYSKARGRKRPGGAFKRRRRSGSAAAFRKAHGYSRPKRRRRVVHLAKRSRRSARGRPPTGYERKAGRTLRRRRWKLRGNPSPIRMLRQGVKDAAGVVAGEISTNLIEGFIPDLPMIGAGAVSKVVKRSGAALGVGYIANRFLGYEWARWMLAGGLASVIKTGIGAVKDMAPLPAVVKSAVDQALSGEDNYYGMGSYPNSAMLPGVGSYPSDALGEGEEAYIMQ